MYVAEIAESSVRGILGTALRSVCPERVVTCRLLPKDPSGRTVALGSTQPLSEMNTRNLPGGKGRSARKADNLTAICETIF
jgi:hypothetical protein